MTADMWRFRQISEDQGRSLNIPAAIGILSTIAAPQLKYAVFWYVCDIWIGWDRVISGFSLPLNLFPEWIKNRPTFMNTPTTFTQDMVIWTRFVGIIVTVERGLLTAKPCLTLPPKGSGGLKQSSYSIRLSVGKPSRWMTLYRSFDSLVVTIASLLKFSVYFLGICNTLPGILLLSLCFGSACSLLTWLQLRYILWCFIIYFRIITRDLICAFQSGV